MDKSQGSRLAATLAIAALQGRFAIRARRWQVSDQGRPGSWFRSTRLWECRPFLTACGHHRATVGADNRVPPGQARRFTSTRQATMQFHPSRASLLLASLVLVAAPTLAASSDWVTHNGNALHDGNVGGVLRARDFSVRWTTTIPGGLPLHAAATGGGLAFVSQSVWFQLASLNALDLNDGHLVWSHSFSSPVYGGIPILNAPAARDRITWISTGGQEDAALWGFDAASGTQLFRTPLGNQWENYLAPTPFGKAVYSEDGSYGGLSAFAASSGSKKWAAAMPQYDSWTPAVDSRNVYTYTTSLQVHNRSTGELAFEIADPAFIWNGYSVRCAPAIGSQNDAVVTQGGRIVAFDLANRSIRWQKAGGYQGQVSIAGGQVVVAKGSTVEAIDEADGTTIASWQAPAGDTAIVSTILLTRNLMFVSTDVATYAVPRSGMSGAAWQIRKSGQLSLGGNGLLLIAGSDGTVTAVDTHPPAGAH
jgi:hypothetical protein